MTSAFVFTSLNIAVSIAAGMVAHALAIAMDWPPEFAVAVGCGVFGGLFGSLQATFIMDARRV